LKAKIEQQLRTKHARFLNATCPAGFAAAYLTMQQNSDADPDEAQRIFEAVDSRMRRLRWDDMRQWKADARVADRRRPPPISVVAQERGFAMLQRFAADFSAPLPPVPFDNWRGAVCSH